MTLLAGDVGGTKTVLALVEEGRLLRRAVYPSARHPDLAAIVADFLGNPKPRVDRACFGVAGPVLDERCRATNLPWLIDARALERDLGIARVALVNDFHALAIGITELPASQLASLHEGHPDARGPRVVLGAGTGLGEAVVIKGTEGYQVLTSEGGHADFAPRNELEIDLLRFMLRRHDRVSYERVVSGPGLVVLYRFLCERGQTPESTGLSAQITADPDSAAALISGWALAGDDRLCAEALHLFVSLYGAEAGNLALKVVARGGVYVAGGIAPKILPKLLDGTFEASFLDKGRMRPVLEEIPVQVVLDPDAGLLGAAAIAAGLAGSRTGPDIG